MKGLLLKDWYVTWKNCKLHLGIILFMTALSLAKDMGLFYLMYVALFAGMIPIYTLSVDEKCGWGGYAQTLPCDRKQIVTGKYLYALCMVGAAAVLMILVWGIRDAITGESFGDTLRGLTLILAFGLIFPAGTLPFMLRWGVEKGRIVMMVLLVLFLAAFFGLSGVLNDEGRSLMEAGSAVSAAPWILLGALVLLAASWLLACRLYEQREL